MAYDTDFRFTLFLDLLSRTEDDQAYATIQSFVTAQSGAFRWKTNQTTEGTLTVRVDLYLPVADRSEVHAKCNLIESNLSALPRSGACVSRCEVLVKQTGMPE